MLSKTQYTILFTIMYMLGIIAFFKECEVLFSILILFVTIFLLFKHKISKIFALIMVATFISGILYTDYKMKDDDLLKSVAPTDAILEGKVTSIPTGTHADKTKFFVAVSKVETNGTIFKTNSKTYITIADAKENYKKIKIGDDIRLNAKLRIPQTSTNPSQFSYQNYLKNFNAFTTAYVTKSGWEIINSPQESKWKFIQNLNKLRQKIIAQHNKIITSPNIEILGGIVFGHNAINPPEDVRNNFIHSGLMHILAASGLNVALIFGIWFFIFSKLKVPYRLGISTGILLIILYTLMTGLGPPVLRAALMLTFALIGKLLNRDADNIALLLLVAAIILIYNPGFLFDVGFQLSFTVTLGLLMFCPIIAEKTKQIPQIIAGSIYVPIIAQIIVAPIQMYYFNNFATYSIFANILSMPFVSIISFLGFTSSIMAMIPKFPSFIITGFDYILNPTISILIRISEFFANLPNALLTTTQCSPLQICIYYFIIVTIFIGLKNSFSKKVLISLIASVILLMGTTISPKNSNLEALFFNVGNADSFLIKTPNNKNIIIDTAHPPYPGGYSQAKAIIYEYLKDNGIKEIDYLIITHYDADHAGGAIELMKLVKINNLILNPIKDSSTLAFEIPQFAKEKKINLIYPQNGQTLMKYKDGNVTLFQTQNTKIDSNESSLVTLISKNNNHILFTGDAEIETIEKLNLPSNIDILKIGHHGADKTINKNFLENKKVKLSILSTGPSAYNHPSPTTVKELQSSNSLILRTDVDNAIKVIITNKNIQTFSFDNKKWKHFKNF